MAYKVYAYVDNGHGRKKMEVKGASPRSHKEAMCLGIALLDGLNEKGYTAMIYYIDTPQGTESHLHTEAPVEKRKQNKYDFTFHYPPTKASRRYDFENEFGAVFDNLDDARAHLIMRWKSKPNLVFVTIYEGGFNRGELHYTPDKGFIWSGANLGGGYYERGVPVNINGKIKK